MLKRAFDRASFALVLLLGVAACGGGGGGTTTVPQQQQPTTVANTASPYYLPQKSGNQWTFSSGSQIRDSGRYTISCTCPVNGTPVEDMDVIDATGNYSGTFFFSKSQSTQTSGIVDTLLAESTNSGTTTSLITDGTTYGLPVNDSAAFAGEHWTNGGETSTITGVNGTQTMGLQIIQQVNSDAFTGPQLAITWGLARGVGFTSLTNAGTTVTLRSFTIDATNSTGAARAPDAVRTLTPAGTVTPATALRMLRALF